CSLAGSVRRKVEPASKEQWESWKVKQDTAMKILFYNHTGQASGAEKVMLLVLAQLNSDRFEAELLCPAEGELQKKAKAIGVSCATVKPLHARFTWRIDFLLRYLSSFVSVIRQTRAHVTRSKPELIHANSIRAGLVISAATIGLRVPIVWHVHDLLPRHPISSLIRLFVLLLPPVRIVAVSQIAGDRLRGSLLRWFSGRVRIAVIHNAVNREKPGSTNGEGKALSKELRLRAGDSRIGIIGNLTPVKGQLELLTAFGDVLKQIPNAALVIVGSTMFNRDVGYQERLVAQAKALGITNRVRFLGQRNDVPRIMRSLDLLVLNSTSEAFPLVGLEGQAYGVPVLSTRVGGVPELITHGHNGWLIPPGDQSKLTEAIVMLIKQEELRERLAANGRKHVEANFTVEKFMKSLEALYAEIARGSQPEQLSPGLATARSRVAVFHDNFAQMGGAEKVAEQIYDLLPGATLHTTAVVPEILSDGLRKAKIKTSWMQCLPGLKRHFRHYFLFYPFAVESVDLSSY